MIEKTIAINSRAIASAEDAIDSIQRNLKGAGATDQAQESAIKNLAVINSDITKLSQENEQLLQKLEARGSETFVQEPTLMKRKVSPKSGVVMVLSVLSVGVLLLVFVFLRKAWLDAAQNSNALEKIHRIKRAFF